MHDLVPRPRVEGERERKLLEAAIEVLQELGYDRLTMEAVASRARASKATLYRRWSTKAGLIVSALQVMNEPAELPNTGTLREDLRRLFCGVDSQGTLVGAAQMTLLANIVTAMTHDHDFADQFRSKVLAPRLELARVVWERAMIRGEVDLSVDLDLLESTLPSVVLYRACVLGETPGPELVNHVIDHIILPAAAGGRPTQIKDFA